MPAVANLPVHGTRNGRQQESGVHGHAHWPDELLAAPDAATAVDRTRRRRPRSSRRSRTRWFTSCSRHPNRWDVQTSPAPRIARGGQPTGLSWTGEVQSPRRHCAEIALKMARGPMRSAAPTGSGKTGCPGMADRWMRLGAHLRIAGNDVRHACAQPRPRQPPAGVGHCAWRTYREPLANPDRKTRTRHGHG